MKGVKELKARIKSVRNIQKITRAMEMVAATKLRRLQDRALATRPFADRIETIMARVAAHADPEASPLFATPPEVRDEAVVVVGADKGLCGAYNSNLLRFASDHVHALMQEGVTPHLYLFGRRASMYFGRIRDLDVAWAFGGTVEKVKYTDVRRTLDLLVKAILQGRVQRVRIVYTQMRSMASFVPVMQHLLPLPRAGEAEEQRGVEDILEPSPDVIMERLIPRYLEMQLYAAILEALASEFAARRMAMKSATDAANDMLGTLGMAYNKARQEGITSELLDIVGGVVALDG